MGSLRSWLEMLILGSAMVLSLWAATSGYQRLLPAPGPPETGYYYERGGPRPRRLFLEVDRMEHAPPLSAGIRATVEAHFRPLNIDVRWIPDEVIPDAFPLNLFDVRRLLVTTRGTPGKLWRDRERYAYALHLVLATVGAGNFRGPLGKHYVQGACFRKRIFPVRGRSDAPGEGMVIFTHNIADALRRRYGEVLPSRWHRAIGEAIAHEIGHLIGYTHGMGEFMHPQLRL